MDVKNTIEQEKVDYTDYQSLLTKFLLILKEEYKDELISLVLYGSVARGNARKDSDVDLIIILETAPVEYYKRSERLIKVLKRIEKRDEFHVLKEKGYFAYLKPIIFSKEEAKENRYLFLDVIEDGVILHDREGFFEDRLKSFKKRLEELGAKRFFLEDGSWYWVLKPDLKPGEVFKL